MDLQWTLIAAFLYLEIFLVVLLILPHISDTTSRWQMIFHSKLLAFLSSRKWGNARVLGKLQKYTNQYFNVFMVLLVIVCLDSIRDVRRFSESPEDRVEFRTNPHAETLLHMKSFRAQRNFYIAGFALFLFLVLRRLVVLIPHTDKLSAEVEAQSKLSNRSDCSPLDKDSDEVNEVKAKYNKSKEEQTNLDADAMKKAL